MPGLTPGPLLCHDASMTSDRTPAAGLQKLLDETERLVGPRVPADRQGNSLTEASLVAVQDNSAIRIREAVEAAD